MATSSSFTVGTSTPVQLASGLKHVMIQNKGPYRVFLGGSGVTDSQGFEVGPSNEPQPMPIGLLALENLYAIADSGAGAGTSEVRVLSYTG
jgi:hypothetical protein